MIIIEFMKVRIVSNLGDWECDYKHGQGYEKFPN